MARPLPKTTAPASRKKRNSGHSAPHALARAAPTSASGRGDRLGVRSDLDLATLARGHSRFKRLHGAAFTSQTTTPASKTNTTGSDEVTIVVTATTRYTAYRSGSRPT